MRIETIQRGRKIQERVDRLVYGKEKKHAYFPTAAWEVNPRLADTLNDPNLNIYVGSIVAAGHMPPYGLTDEQLTSAGIFRDDQGNIESLTREQTDALTEIRGGKSKPLRFLDTQENNRLQRKALYSNLKRVYLDAKEQGADKVLFSVCSISAGFDLNYSNALLQLMEEEGPKNFVYSVYLPFNEDAVTRYSIPHGLHPEEWKKEWKRLQNLKNDPLYRDSIFIHSPHFSPYFYSDQREDSPNEEKMHKRGKLLNDDPNAVYSDVNRIMVHQAMKAVKYDTSKIQGLFGETFLQPKSDIGGAPEVMAMLYHAGVPFENIQAIQVGLLDPNPMSIEAFDKLYRNVYRERLRRWDKNRFVRNIWQAPKLGSRNKFNIK